MPVESTLLLQSRFAQAGKHNLSLHNYPGADHRLTNQGVSHRPEILEGTCEPDPPRAAPRIA